MFPYKREKLKKLKKFKPFFKILYIQETGLCDNKHVLRHRRQNVNVLQVTAPCLSVVCVKGGPNMQSGVVYLLRWHKHLCLTTSILD